MTVKISYEISEAVLPSELAVVKLTLLQKSPQSSFGGSAIVT
jgi:hypothetical protein